jgi:hypothetical protein
MRREPVNTGFDTIRGRDNAPDPSNKDAVRRILAIHYRPTSTEGGASWLTFIGHMKDRYFFSFVRENCG